MHWKSSKREPYQAIEAKLLKDGSPNLLLEGFLTADFRSNYAPTHLPVIFKQF